VRVSRRCVANPLARRSVLATALMGTLASALVAPLVARPLYAQDGSQDKTLPVTPAEYQYGQMLYGAGILSPVNGQNQLFPVDSVDAAVVAQTKRWIAELQSRPRKGIQLDPMGQLYVSVGADDIAKQQFAERLATPGLSLPDKAYTLVTAVETFAGVDDAKRVPTALEYMKQLDALPASMITFQFRGHIALAYAYYYLEEQANAIEHFRKAFALVPAMPFERRMMVYMQTPFVPYADLLIDQPHGRATIDSLGRVLTALAIPSPDLVAKDSTYYWYGASWSQMFADAVHLTSHLGLDAPPVIGTFWFNTTAPNTPLPDPLAKEAGIPNARAKMLNDGKVRVIQFCTMNTPGCIAGVAGLGRLAQAVPAAEPWFSTSSEGNWGATPMEADAEAGHLKHFYVERKKVTIPIALWGGPKDRKPWGGMVPRDNPGVTVYPMGGVMYALVDSKGVVRHIMRGYSKQTERVIQSRLRQLTSTASNTSNAGTVAMTR